MEKYSCEIMPYVKCILSLFVSVREAQFQQAVALTGRNTTGPPCRRGAIIRLEAA